MKNLFITLLIISIAITACNDNTVDLTEDITGTYSGEIHVLPSTNVSNYMVTVTRVNDSRVKITPQDGNAATWEMDIAKNSPPLLPALIVA